MKEIYKFRDQESQIHDLLKRLVGEGAAAFFHDACSMMQEDADIQSKSHLIGHCLREIESALRDVMLPDDYDFPVDKDVGKKSDKRKCYEPPKIKHKQEVEACVELYEIEKRPAEFWLKLTKKDFSFANLAHRRALLGPRPIESINWEETQAWLYYILKKIEGKVPGRFVQTIDTILQSKTPSVAIKTLKSKVALSQVNLRYFFEKLQNPDWLDSLHSQDFFDTPQPPRIHEDGGISYPSWPIMMYLKSIVDKVPKKVGEICIKIDTDNRSIQSDLLAISLHLPMEYAIKIGAKASAWTETPNTGLSHIDRELGNLIAYLGSNNKIKESIALARKVLVILPDPKPTREIDGMSLGPNPNPLLNEWEYGKIINENILPQSSKYKTELIELFAELLNEYNSLSKKKNDKSNEDYSYIWRPAIEEHEQNHDRHDVRNILIKALRDTCEYAINNDVGIERVLNILAKYTYTVFHRIRLHLLRLYPDGLEKIIEEELISETNIISSSIRHEFYNLAVHQGQNISNIGKQKILKFILKGPDMGSYISYRKKNKLPISKKILNGYTLGWQIELLAPFSTIYEPINKEYKKLIKDAGKEPENADFSVYQSSKGGSFSPKSPIESTSLLGKSVEEIVNYLSTWKPEKENDYFESSMRGLSDVLKGVASHRAEEFSATAISFIDLDPSYVRGVIDGIKEAVNQGRQIDWVQALNLANWAIQQKRDNVKGKRHFLLSDPSWDWCINSIIGLLEAGMSNKGKSELSFTLKKTVWEILTTVAHNPDPVLEEQEQSTEKIDALSLSINSTKGEAMHAVMKYSVWVWNKHQGEKNRNAQEMLPEFFTELEYHLNPKHDQSIAVRAVYGQWLTWLADLNSGWIVANLKAIFPGSIKTSKLYQASWEAYITYSSQISIPSFQFIKPVYTHAVNNLGYFVLKPKSYHETPDERLGEHLALLYLLGAFELDDKDLLIETFIRNASDTAISAMINFVGQELEKHQDNPKIISERSKGLWNLILRLSPELDKNLSNRLSDFGSWFSSGAIDELWSLINLEILAKSGLKIEHDFAVIEHMEVTIEKYPDETIRVLCYLIDNMDDGIVSYLGINIENVIKIGYRKNETSKKLVEEISNKLVSRGHQNFRKYTQ